ncbi:hypothetical protein [Azospirillum largimobile]
MRTPGQKRKQGRSKKEAFVHGGPEDRRLRKRSGLRRWRT